MGQGISKLGLWHIADEAQPGVQKRSHDNVDHKFGTPRMWYFLGGSRVTQRIKRRQIYIGLQARKCLSPGCRVALFAVTRKTQQL